jgi:hypothetical protein
MRIGLLTVCYALFGTHDVAARLMRGSLTNTSDDFEGGAVSQFDPDENYRSLERRPSSALFQTRVGFSALFDLGVDIVSTLLDYEGFLKWESNYSGIQGSCCAPGQTGAIFKLDMRGIQFSFDKKRARVTTFPHPEDPANKVMLRMTIPDLQATIVDVMLALNASIPLVFRGNCIITTNVSLAIPSSDFIIEFGNMEENIIEMIPTSGSIQTTRLSVASLQANSDCPKSLIGALELLSFFSGYAFRELYAYNFTEMLNGNITEAIADYPSGDKNILKHEFSKNYSMPIFGENNMLLIDDCSTKMNIENIELFDFSFSCAMFIGQLANPAWRSGSSISVQVATSQTNTLSSSSWDRTKLADISVFGTTINNLLHIVTYLAWATVVQNEPKYHSSVCNEFQEATDPCPFPPYQMEHRRPSPDFFVLATAFRLRGFFKGFTSSFIVRPPRVEIGSNDVAGIFEFVAIIHGERRFNSGSDVLARLRIPIRITFSKPTFNSDLAKFENFKILSLQLLRISNESWEKGLRPRFFRRSVLRIITRGANRIIPIFLPKLNKWLDETVEEELPAFELKFDNFTNRTAALFRVSQLDLTFFSSSDSLPFGAINVNGNVDAVLTRERRHQF